METHSPNGLQPTRRTLNHIPARVPLPRDQPEPLPRLLFLAKFLFKLFTLFCNLCAGCVVE